jgi:hypothetical protein
MRGIPNPSRCQPRRLSAFLSAFCETGDRQKSESNLAAFAESNRIWVYLALERSILLRNGLSCKVFCKIG